MKHQNKIVFGLYKPTTKLLKYCIGINGHGNISLILGCHLVFFKYWKHKIFKFFIQVYLHSLKIEIEISEQMRTIILSRSIDNPYILIQKLCMDFYIPTKVSNSPEYLFWCLKSKICWLVWFPLYLREFPLYLQCTIPIFIIYKVNLSWPAFQFLYFRQIH